VRKLIDAANPGRDRLMLEIAYFGGLRVSELVALTWAQVIRRDSGEAQLEVIGKGDKVRQVLIPAVIAARLLASRADAPASAPAFESVRNPGHALTERAVNFIVKAAAKRAGVLRHAHASHAIDNGAPITLVSATLGHADLKTTSVYAHARPSESSGRYLKTKWSCVPSPRRDTVRKRTVKLWRLTEDGRKLSAGTIEASSSSNGVPGRRPREGSLRHLPRQLRGPGTGNRDCDSPGVAGSTSPRACPGRRFTGCAIATITTNQVLNDGLTGALGRLLRQYGK
jgi:hypothetical protein